MKKNKNNAKTDIGTMVTVKTNEDFNNKQPTPADFKEIKKSVINNSGSKKLKTNKP